MVLGIDGTCRAAMGWAAIQDDGSVGGYGEYPRPSQCDEDGMVRDYYADVVRTLISQWRPRLVAIEAPIVNTQRVDAQIDRAGDPLNGSGRSAGRSVAATLKDTLKLAIMIGNLERVAKQAGCAAILVNPAEVKLQAVGSVAATKQAMRAAARMVLAGSSGQTIDAVKLPTEHAADALFIALAGERLARTTGW